MAVPQASARFYREQQRIAEVTTRSILRLWRGAGDDFDAGWASIRPDATRLLLAGVGAAISSAAAYTPRLLDETGITAPAAGELVPEGFIGLSTDGALTDQLLDAAPIRAKQAIGGGALAAEARRQAGAWLTMKILTGLADVRRDVVAVDLTRRPNLLGYTRMLNPPSCPRCAILAGKWFRWNQGFERHPRCDCVHIPAQSEAWARAEGFVSDPYEYFHSLSVADQNRIFGALDAQAIRDGADIYRVVNIRTRGLAISRQAMKYGTPTRLMVNDIYAMNLSRGDTIRVLAQEGYITGPQRAGGNIVGRYREAFQTPISRPIVPGSRRDRVLRARETGIRDPLDRATMTAAERRLFDAVYRREYALQYGYLPRTIGMNSADKYSGLVGLPATKQRIALLDAEISAHLARIKSSQTSLMRLVDELGLKGDEYLTGQVFRRIEDRVGLAALRPEVVAQARRSAGTVRTSEQGWARHQAFARAERAALPRAGGLPPGKGPPRLPPATPPEPDGWPDDLPELSRDTWAHILFGDTKSGGHQHGYGWLHGRSEFPEDWEPATIMGAMAAVLRAPTGSQPARGGGVDHTGVFRGVTLTVRVGALGRIATAFPTGR